MGRALQVGTEQSAREGSAGVPETSTGLKRYLAAAVLVRLADEGARVGLVLLALERGAGAAVGGLLVAALLVPHVVAAPLVGLVVDRARRAQLALAVAAAGLTTALLVTAGALGRLPLPVVVVVLLLGGCCGPTLTGALTSQLARLVPPPRLPRAFGLDSVSYNVAGVVGPALAAVVAGARSATDAVLVLAGCALVGALVLSTLPLPVRPAATGSSAAPETAGSSRFGSAGVAGSGAEETEGVAGAPTLGAGVRAVFGDRVLGVVTAVSSLGQLGPGGLAVVAAVLAARQHQPAAAGWLMASVAAGGLLGSLLWTWRPAGAHRAPQVVLVSLAGLGGCLAVSAAVSSLAVTAALFAVSGVFTGPFTGALFTVRQDRAPEQVRAQVFALGAGLKTSAAAAGAGVAGLLVPLASPALLLFAGGFPLAAAAGGALLLSRTRRR